MQKITGPPWLTSAAGSQDLQRSGLGVTLGWQVNQKASHYDTEVMFLSARPELGLPPPSCLSLPAGDKLSSALLPAKLESTRVMGGYRNAEALMGHRLHGRGATPKPPITGGDTGAEGAKQQAQLWGGRAQPRASGLLASALFYGAL
uniref:Uncharacterized protein n=1 Tax=Myotis myotis TaxID=51298 RepID=A0A7J7V3L7_MYOMY|nr:hypothetical protein mMyoMyo1_008514 [Myotis myotis]